MCVSSVGLIIANAVALAMADEGARAGSAAALLGVLQFAAAAGAAVAPLVGLGGVSAVPMGIVMAAASGAALLSYRVLRGRPAAA